MSNTSPTIGQALVWLHATQGFLRLPRAKDGRPYAPGYFARRNWVETLDVSENRRVSIRLSRHTECVACGQAMNASSTGDHIIPRSKDGPRGAQNYLPLCGNCNPSKGTRDLIEWWHGRGRSVRELPLDVVVAYARLTWQWHRDRGTLISAAPAWLAAAASSYLDSLPSDAHRSAVRALPFAAPDSANAQERLW